MDNICGKRIAAGISDMIDVLKKHGEINFNDEICNQLKTMSSATIDRLLVSERKKFVIKGKSTTKPGTLLKKDIALKTASDWDDTKPGFVEIDLVAHCGDTTVGEYVNTLTTTDVSTGWTVTKAVLNKAQTHVFNALKEIRKRLPFDLKGIDSDNGSEFINHQLYRYCKQESITFTRSRPYKKNDSCYVEQKNWSIVRRQLGYARYEGQESVGLMNKIHRCYNNFSNHFLPSIKLLSKERIGGKIKKKYEKPLTPYQRILNSPEISEQRKQDLMSLHSSLNPVELKKLLNYYTQKIINFSKR